MIKEGTLIHITSLTSMFHDHYGIVEEVMDDLYHVRITYTDVGDIDIRIIMHILKWLHCTKVEKV